MVRVIYVGKVMVGKRAVKSVHIFNTVHTSIKGIHSFIYLNIGVVGKSVYTYILYDYNILYGDSLLYTTKYNATM